MPPISYLRADADRDVSRFTVPSGSSYELPLDLWRLRRSRERVIDSVPEKSLRGPSRWEKADVDRARKDDD